MAWTILSTNFKCLSVSNGLFIFRLCILLFIISFIVKLPFLSRLFPLSTSSSRWCHYPDQHVQKLETLLEYNPHLHNVYCRSTASVHVSTHSELPVWHVKQSKISELFKISWYDLWSSLYNMKVSSPPWCQRGTLDSVRAVVVQYHLV